MNETEIDPNYKRPTHIDQLGLDHKTIDLPAEIIAKVDAATKNGTQDYHKGYTIIADYLEKTEQGPKELAFWFGKAAEINSDDNGAPANAAIRGGNIVAANHDGRDMSAEYQQELSDDIGIKVIKRIREGAVPNLYTITQKDALSTIESIAGDKPVDISNWVGAAWSWNIPITIKGVTKSIGEHILSSPEKLEKFKKVQAAAGYHGIGVVSNPSEFTEIWRMKNDPIMGPPAHIRDEIQERIINQYQNKWRRELPHDANDPYSKHDFGGGSKTPKSETPNTDPEDKTQAPSSFLKDGTAQETSNLIQPENIVIQEPSLNQDLVTNATTGDLFSVETWAERFRNKYNKSNEQGDDTDLTLLIDRDIAQDPPIKPLQEPKRVRIASKRVKRPMTDPLPKKGPERVKADPSYNPFDFQKNQFEDLEGEAYVWNTDLKRRNKNIVAAGRQKFFNLNPEDIS